MKQPDILIYMSDQHSPVFSGWGRERVDTPCLDGIREQGASLEECYTSCPLCVPARMSMLASRLPDKTGVYTNFDTLSDMEPTFLYPFVEAGYETVFIGRMHFVGKDQRHGFTKRLAGDITPVSFTRPTDKLRAERGVFCQTFGDPWCLDVIGGGESPVLHYDEMVVETAVRYLEETHEKPQLVFVGTYAPHFPYVAPEKLYKKYLDRVEVPDTFEHSLPMNPLLERRKKQTDRETARQAMAAYCGMIEHMDGQIGRVKEAFEAYAKSKGNGHIFCYLSDHGDQVGEHRMFGKQTFFEKSAKIPMIFQGTGIRAGARITSPASILDLGPTLCGLSGIGYDMETDGVNLAGVLTGETVPDADRVVLCQFMETGPDGQNRYAVMARGGRYKFITYHGFEDQDMMFDVEKDPQERCNIIKECPEEAERLRKAAKAEADPAAEEENASRRARMVEWMKAWEQTAGADDTERWKDNPESARGIPAVR